MNIQKIHTNFVKILSLGLLAATTQVFANEAPSISIVTPSDDTHLLKGEPYSIIANASDADGTVTKVEFYNYNQLIATSTLAPYRIAGSTNNVALGTYSITTRAYDNQGAVTTSTPVKITIHSKPVTTNVVITTPNNTTFTQGESYSILANATDVLGIQKVEFYYNKDNLFSVSNTPPFKAEGPTDNTPPGTYLVTAKAYNAEGVATTSESVAIIIQEKGTVSNQLIVPANYQLAIKTFDKSVSKYLDGPGAGTPIFNGSWDWHSSVHGHLAKVLNFEATNDKVGLEAFVKARYTPEKMQGEINSFNNDIYGWAWLLQLDVRLKMNGITTLTPMANYFGQKLLDSASRNIGFNGFNGSYTDVNWWLACLYQWAVINDDANLATQVKKLFIDWQNSVGLIQGLTIGVGDFFSVASISSYAHSVIGIDNTINYQKSHDALLNALNDGSLDQYLANQTAIINSGRVGWNHGPGIAISLSYGYWALFKQTKNPAFYQAYIKVTDFNLANEAKIGENIQVGHWLPHFASFGAGLPSYLVVADPDGGIQAKIQAWGK